MSRFIDVDADEDAPSLVDYLDCVGDHPAIQTARSWAVEAMYGDVLDVGCGTGETASLAARRGKTRQVVGVDASATLIDLARRRHTDLENATFVVGLADRVPASDHSFDVVSFERLLMHVSSPNACLECFSRVLRPGGLLIMIEPQWGAVELDLGSTTDADWFRRQYLSAIRHLDIPTVVSAWCQANGWILEAEMHSALRTEGFNDTDDIIRFRNALARTKVSEDWATAWLDEWKGASVRMVLPLVAARWRKP